MTFALFFVLFVVGAPIVLLLMGRRGAPADAEEWNRKLRDDSARLLGALELQVRTDQAMAEEALRQAVRARDSRAFERAIELVDIAYEVLASALPDRRSRLNGMLLCVRMASAVCPAPPMLRARGVRTPEVRLLVAGAGLAQHVLVATAERMALRIMLLRAAYGMTLRAFRRSRVRVAERPDVLASWRGAEDAVPDWTDVFDPAHVEAYRALLASAAERA